MHGRHMAKRRGRGFETQQGKKRKEKKEKRKKQGRSTTLPPFQSRLSSGGRWRRGTSVRSSQNTKLPFEISQIGEEAGVNRCNIGEEAEE